MAMSSSAPTLSARDLHPQLGRRWRRWWGEKLWPSFRLREVPMALGAGVTIKLQDLPLGIDPTEIIMGRSKDVVPRMLPQ